MVHRLRATRVRGRRSVLEAGVGRSRRFDDRLLKIPYVLRPLMFGSSLDTLRADNFRLGLAASVSPKWYSVARRTAA
jgi:hypothetical protein